ncbi:hypothetical protein [Mucilaginibacter lacusdianchii]|uniref:hypothetical protein n=1 Tax=Mucilaginibacter lacusdianchii TaxID=2684211 RepID=UPI00131D4771|nr:hypothetical protein [Mucilaginibacter sp. JXJ CY 39]
MWKRIHSNRDPKDTLQRELRREFGRYFGAAGTGLKALVSKKPKWTFAFMAVLLALSAVLSFTRPRPPAGRGQQAARAVEVSDGFRQLMHTTARLRKTIELKGLIDSLAKKPRLTGADSVRLNRALDSLAALQKILIHPRYEH